ncbi:uncharacterized protein LOC121728125 [Aricia agestis]|uniref:uncharacterized protein LOC121728125 n=1 Tax=Aricia agestis TaxID=91739 RepID=UPI001C2065D4|nr:uncharacterized protein LOC121728125 [Aricia agestis]
MCQRRWFSCVLALCLLANAFCVPATLPRLRRQSVDDEKSDNSTNQITNDDDEMDDDFDEPESASGGGGGGSNLFSLLNIATSLLPAASSSSSKILKKLIELAILLNKPKVIIKRSLPNDVDFNSIDVLTPPFLQKQEKDSESNSSNSENNNSENSNSEQSDEDNAAEESIENKDASTENSDSNGNDIEDDSDYDSDEPPGGGDGQGGGILGLLAGLSGGEDGQSDLGSLLATVSGIIANLSGDGIDLNSLIASGIGLFVGLLSEGEENPGTVIASYLLTSLDTITGGGAKNNGAFFGKFLSKLVKGTSAGGDPDASSEENGEAMKDSAGFLLSFLMGLSGDMSKGSSGPHPWGSQQPAEGSSPLWTLKLDVLRALFQFATSVLGLSSSQASSMG